jgi:argininosuccinate lyase
LVRAAEQAGVTLDKVSATVAAEIHPALGPALAQLGTWEQSVESRATPGGASRASVESQIEDLRRLFQPAASP